MVSSCCSGLLYLISLSNCGKGSIAMLKRLRAFEWPACLLALLAAPVCTDLPYNPTRLLPAPNHAGELVYVFQQTSPSPSSFRLLSLNTTRPLQASSLPYKTISTSLPFLGTDDGVAFTPVIDEWGSISVYAGSCVDGAKGGELWRFTPDNRTLNGDGSWAKETLSFSDFDRFGNMTGANYLASGFSFSSTVGGGQNSSDTYIFGGMCPTAPASSDDWTSSAEYSNSMLTLTTATPSSNSTEPTEYKLGMTVERGPPIAEAGFSMTGLDPSFTNSSSGHETRQQNFVLLGGHTHQAFINTSQVTIFSLPEESWTFLSVNSPPSNASTGPSPQGTTRIDPRSGHTAVLSPDGKKLVVFGGWVGDVTTPAEPQLVVLEVGEGYGGSGEWTWSMPEASGDGPHEDLHLAPMPVNKGGTNFKPRGPVSNDVPSSRSTSLGGTGKVYGAIRCGGACKQAVGMGNEAAYVKRNTERATNKLLLCMSDRSIANWRGSGHDDDTASPLHDLSYHPSTCKN